MQDECSSSMTSGLRRSDSAFSPSCTAEIWLPHFNGAGPMSMIKLSFFVLHACYRECSPCGVRNQGPQEDTQPNLSDCKSCALQNLAFISVHFHARPSIVETSFHTYIQPTFYGDCTGKTQLNKLPIAAPHRPSNHLPTIDLWLGPGFQLPSSTRLNSNLA